MLRSWREPEHPQDHSKGQSGFGAGSGGTLPFPECPGQPQHCSVHPSCIPGQISPSSLHEPSWSLEKAFLPVQLPALERSSASPSNDVHTPAVFCSLGFWPPRQPTAPRASPQLPLPRQDRNKPHQGKMGFFLASFSFSLNSVNSPSSVAHESPVR